MYFSSQPVGGQAKRNPPQSVITSAECATLFRPIAKLFTCSKRRKLAHELGRKRLAQAVGHMPDLGASIKKAVELKPITENLDLKQAPIENDRAPIAFSDLRDRAPIADSRKKIPGLSDCLGSERFLRFR